MTYANIINTAVFVVLVCYTWFTWRIEKAAVKQTEGLSKPAIVVRCSTPDPSDEAILDGKTDAHIPGIFVEIMNIGDGPAIKLECDAIRKRSEELPPYQHRTEVPYLEARQSFAIPFTRTGLTPNNYCLIKCSYDSLSGNKHTSTSELYEDKVKSVGFSETRASSIRLLAWFMHRVFIRGNNLWPIKRGRPPVTSVRE